VLAVGLLACAPVAPPAAPPAPPPAPPPAVAAAPPVAAQLVADSDAEYGFADPDRRKKLASAFPAIDALVEATVQKHGLPGMVLGVVIDGELAFAKGAGVSDVGTKAVPDADTVYAIGSITKSFTALSVLALRDDGALSLDDPLTRFLPEAAGLVYPTRDAPPITLRQVLTHTSGLPRLGNFDYTRSDAAPSEEEVVRSLSAFPLENPPGSAWVYSNLGYGLLGILVGRAAHAPLRTFMAKRIFEPLGMTATTFEAAHPPAGRLATGYQKASGGEIQPVPGWRLGASEGAGGIASSVRDMARYVAFQLDAYPPRSAPEKGPIRRSSVRETHANALKSGRLHVGLRSEAVKGESLVHAGSDAYGYAWTVHEDCDFDEVVRHSGAVAGFNSSVAFLPAEGVGVVALTNVNGDDFDIGAVSADALRALKKTGGLSPRVKRGQLSPLFATAMARFLAVYNAWDEGAYKAMLSTHRGRAVPAEDERRELAGYRGVNGACKGYEPIEVISPRVARLAMQCERGALEMFVALDEQGLIKGFGGTSRDVPAPPAVAKAAERIAGLVRKLDAAVYRKLFPTEAAAAHAERLAFFDKVRATYGACAPKGYTRTDTRQELTLACDRGGDLTLQLTLDAKNEEAVSAFALTPVPGGACPVR
jgi:CubicO group peptidase (beta-lactamase class C family)